MKRSTILIVMIALSWAGNGSDTAHGQSSGWLLLRGVGSSVSGKELSAESKGHP